MSNLYIIGTNLAEINEVMRHANDAHDPLNYFSFDDGIAEKLPGGIVRATKDGAAAGYYANELENRLNELGLKVTVRVRLITPHKGGRTVKKSTDVTPEVAEMLAELHQNYGISLGDLIEESARRKIEELQII